MDHRDHVNLLRDGVSASGGTWADFGSGGGAFTLALADLLGPGAAIYSIDQDGRALREQQRHMQRRFPGVDVHYLAADFTHPLDLPPLDGLVMANSLHFHRDKLPIVRQLRRYLKPHGVFLLIEYNTDRGNRWVPYPLSYTTWEALAREAGLRETMQIAAHPSRFLREIYAAASRNGTSPDA